MNFDFINSFLNDKFFDIKWFNPSYLFGLGADFFRTITPYLFRGHTLDGFRFILSLFCLFFVIIIAYTTVRILEIRKKEHEHLHEEIEEYAHHQAAKEKKAQEVNQSTNPNWNKVLMDVFSPNAGDWKLSIVEADIMLDALLSQLGLKGESVGDKLKSADKDKFKSLTFAWEVHTVRNRIAHEGLNFEISQKEAKRIIALYEQIFREFGFI